jgi:hypothetical protein
MLVHQCALSYASSLNCVEDTFKMKSFHVTALYEHYPHNTCSIDATGVTMTSQF